MNQKIRKMTYCAMFAGILTVFAQIIVPLPVTPVPITLQTLGIMACAVVLPPFQTICALFVYVLMGAIGLPVFAGLSGGVAKIFGPTGGFIIGWFPAAFVLSLLIQKGAKADTQKKTPEYARLVCGMLIFTITVYLTGLLWFIPVMKVDFKTAFLSTTLPFLPGDALKCVVIAFLYPALLKLRLH